MNLNFVEQRTRYLLAKQKVFGSTEHENASAPLNASELVPLSENCQNLQKSESLISAFQDQDKIGLVDKAAIASVIVGSISVLAGCGVQGVGFLMKDESVKSIMHIAAKTFGLTGYGELVLATLLANLTG